MSDKQSEADLLYLPPEVQDREALREFAGIILFLAGFLLGAIPMGPLWFVGLAAGFFALRFTRWGTRTAKAPPVPEAKRLTNLMTGAVLGFINLLAFDWIPAAVVWILFITSCKYFKEAVKIIATRAAK